jgi:hypothetical protein
MAVELQDQETFRGFVVAPEQPFRTPPEAQEPKRDLEGITFTDFPEQQETWIRQLFIDTGLPLNYVNTVEYKPTANNRPANTTAEYNYPEKRITLFKSLQILPRIAQLGVVAHELGHAAEPTEHPHLYKSPKEAEQARLHATTVALQSLLSNTFINGYQKMLARQLISPDVSSDEAPETRFERYVRETHAIMLEVRFTNPKHLRDIQTVQRTKIAKQVGENNLNGSQMVTIGNRMLVLPVYTDIITPNPQHTQEAVGVDRTLLSLMPQFETVKQVDDHINSVRKSLSSVQHL